MCGGRAAATARSGAFGVARGLLSRAGAEVYLMATASPSLHPVWPTLRAVALTVVPDARRLDEGAWREMRRVMEGALGARRPEAARQLRAFLRLLQWLPIARYGRRFAALDPSRRERVLAALQGCPLTLLRRGVWGLRTMVLMGYYGRVEAAREIGYAPDLRGWGAQC
jgi:hypothetical protein